VKLTLFGATGPSGKLLVQKAVAAGHDLTIYARDPGKLGIAGPLYVKGDLSDPAAIETAIAGAGAVISLLGPTGKSKGTPVTDGTRHIVRAMQAHGVKRLVATATPSATDPNDRSSFSFGLAVGMIKLLAGSAYREIVGTAEVIRTSPLDWTLVRLPMLSDKPTHKPAVAGYVGDPRIKLFSLSRDALADFLLAQVADSPWVRKSPALSNGD